MRLSLAALLCCTFILALLACGDSGGNPEDNAYQDAVEQAWNSFAAGNYSTSVSEFRTASALDNSESEAFVGIAWSLMYLDSLQSANAQFVVASGKNNAPADLYAGWAFSLNARQSYTGSNEKTDQLIAQDANWRFMHGLDLDINTIRWLRASNYFLLGEFENALTEVQVLNSAFTANVATHDGRTALAAEIERLRQ